MLKVHVFEYCDSFVRIQESNGAEYHNNLRWILIISVKGAERRNICRSKYSGEIKRCRAPKYQETETEVRYIRKSPSSAIFPQANVLFFLQRYALFQDQQEGLGPDVRC